LPRSASSEDKDVAITAILDRLNISGCQNVRIGGGGFRKGISGGERKRTSVACELVTNPSMIFLDEPTSGLDSTSAASLVANLRDLAREGRTIIATIHQPSSDVFHMFDKLILLAKPGNGTGGNLAYFGDISGVAPFFEKCGFPVPPNTNTADHILKVITAINQTQPDGSTVTVNQSNIEHVVNMFDTILRDNLHREALKRSTE
jgi:ABC-type multidrug transport system ATPase subunit